MAKKRNPPEKQAAKSSADRTKANARTTPVPSQTDFDIVLGMIDAARARAVAAVNTELIDLYWSIGGYISLKITSDGWGKGTVEALAEYIQHRKPGVTGFSASNEWRMRQFYEIYRAAPKLAPLVRELSWTNNLLILSRSKREEEREFYLRLFIEYALSRAASPAMVAEYQTRLPDKTLLQAKLHEFYELAQEPSTPTALESPKSVAKERPKKKRTP